MVNGKQIMESNSKILVSGYTGLVGSAITKILRSKGYTNLLLKDVRDLDMTNQADVKAFFEKEKPSLQSAVKT